MSDSRERARTGASQETLDRVRGLIEADDSLSGAAAIRRVAAEMNRTEAAVSSAYYTALRRERAETELSRSGTRRQRQSDRRDAISLYRDMLPLVEAGASPHQAARRFGGEDVHAEAVAAGFARWYDRDARDAGQPTGQTDTRLDDAEARLASLDAENRTLRRQLTRSRQALTRVRAIVDGAISEPDDE